MELWFLLFLLSFTIYLIAIRSVAKLTQTNQAESAATQSAKVDSKPPLEDPSKIRPISQSEESDLRHCFPWGVYYLQNIDYRPQAILCRGTLRATPEEAYQTVQKNIESKFSDRFLVIFQEGLRNKPFFALVPNPNAKSQPERETERLIRPGLALGLLFITLFTTTLVGTEMAGITLEQVQSDPSYLLGGLPYALALVGILGVHELGHFLTTCHYNIRATLPYFIPIPFFLGTFGAYIQMRSPVPNRKALFDVSVAGPLAGLIAALPALFWGLSQSEIIPLSDTSSILNFSSLDPRPSLLLSLLSRWTLGSEFGPGTAIALHPVGVAGFIGLVVTALNLMPVGQLDGGHIVHAMFGQKIGAVIGQIARLLLFVLAIAESSYLLWAIILLFMPIIDEPALNDVSELDNGRDLLGMLCLVLLVVILLPMPGSLMQALNF